MPGALERCAEEYADSQLRPHRVERTTRPRARIPTTWSATTR